MAEEQRRQGGQAEEAVRHTGELIEGEIQVHQVRKAGKGHGQSGQEARKRVTLCIIKTVSWNQRRADISAFLSKEHQSVTVLQHEHVM